MIQWNLQYYDEHEVTFYFGTLHISNFHYDLFEGNRKVLCEWNF